MVRWRIKEVAQERNIDNPHSLALAAQLSYNSVRPMWNNETTRADLRTLDKLSRVLHVQPGDLLERVDEEGQPA